ncbi:MAG TPA: endonuclease MutS2 [Gemmatimonadaceae bacterium]|nr:endonuclease MutS2 [Gemmatimonadaceae bacterium]
MNPHGLSILEYPRVLDIVAGHASSDAGGQRVRSYAPRTDREWLENEHARVAAVRTLVSAEEPWHPYPIADVSAALSRLRVEGVALGGPELNGIGTLLRSSRLTTVALRDQKRPAITRAVLEPLIARLYTQRGLEDEIVRALDDDGEVRDDASPSLRRIRRELRSAHAELIRLLEGAMQRLDPSQRVSDMSVTLRNGRYVIPIRREARTSIGGIVHDASSSGATLFIEPPAAVEFGNRMRELESEEVEEVDRILRALSDAVRPHREPLLDALDALIELDTLYARARFAIAFGCNATALAPSREGFSVVDGRHPLLLAQGRAVIPFDLAMEPAERTLLVSGPNTGGKTVLLKALGLLSALAQSGIPAPAGPESRLPLFDDVFADVGDEQSIEASLSTFSAHLKNLSEILRLATPQSLVLIDELGSGTDPIEGAALGWAILEELTRRGAFTVATTHLGTLKELASQVPGVVNASLQFDAVALAPTYRLIKGVPGRSYGIAIARRLSLSETVIRRAEERLPQQERDMAALIEKLEAKEAELAEREKEAETILADARERVASVSRRERNVRERERNAERESRKDARRYLLDARAEIERTISDLRKQGSERADEAGREARRKVEEMAGLQSRELDRLEREEANLQRAQVPSRTREASAVPEEGDSVAVATLDGRVGRLIERRGNDALIAVGEIKMTVPMKALSRVEPEQARTAVAWRGDLPEVEVKTEVDVRGHRVDEAESALLQALDSAIRADLRSLRIIHGKGTGALRELVNEMLRKDTRVKGFRLGAWNEGGTGVTVVDLG